MDTFNQASTGAKVVLGSTIAFLIVSFFNWYEADLGEFDDVVGIDAGASMWNGVGVAAGLVALALLVWQLLPFANVKLEVGVSLAMVTFVLAVLMLLFTLIRVIDGYDFADRTIWLWLGLLFAVAAAVGAWMNLQAAGESLADLRASLSKTMGGGDADTGPAATTGTAATTTAAAPATPEAEATEDVTDDVDEDVAEAPEAAPDAPEDEVPPKPA